MSAQWQAQYGWAIGETDARKTEEIDPSLNLYDWTASSNVAEELDAWLTPIAREIRSWAPGGSSRSDAALGFFSRGWRRRRHALHGHGPFRPKPSRV